MLEELKTQVYQANMELPRRGSGHLYLGKCKRDRPLSWFVCDQTQRCGL